MQSLAYWLGRIVRSNHTPEFQICLDTDPTKAIRFHAHDLSLVEKTALNFVIFNPAEDLSCVGLYH